MIREIRKKLIVLSNRSPFPAAVKEYIDHLEKLDWIYMNLRLDGSPLSREEVEKILGGEMVINGRIMDHVLVERLGEIRRELYDLMQRRLDIGPELIRNITAKTGADTIEFRKTTPQLVEYEYTPVLPAEIPGAMSEFWHLPATGMSLKILSKRRQACIIVYWRFIRLRRKIRLRRGL